MGEGDASTKFWSDCDDSLLVRILREIVSGFCESSPKFGRKNVVLFS